MYDCSDKSDEQEITKYIEDYRWCPLTASRFDCDEATAHNKYFACGDGEFVEDIIPAISICYNYRLNMFFCEYRWNYEEESMWTLQNGHCVNQTSLEKNFIDMNELEKCVFYLKCHLNGYFTM